MKTLNSASLKDLPSVVKFLQETVSEADVAKVCIFGEKSMNSSLSWLVPGTIFCDVSVS